MSRVVAAGDRSLAEMRRGTLQYCVLALLACEERYGFELVRSLGRVEPALRGQPRNLGVIVGRGGRDRIFVSMTRDGTHDGLDWSSRRR